MPYVMQAIRDDVEAELRSVARRLITQGDLTYAISVLMDEYVMSVAGAVTYHTLSRARASAQDASDEWYRRVMAPYEDSKRRENGDVYHVVGYISHA